MKRKKPLPIYYKLIVDGKLVDVFPVQSGRTRSHFPPHYRRLLTLKGVSLTSSSQSEYEDFTKRPRP
jgi:hypothetical protein